MFPPVIANGLDNTALPHDGFDVLLGAAKDGKLDSEIVPLASTVVPLEAKKRYETPVLAPILVSATFTDVIVKLSPAAIGSFCRIRVAPLKGTDVAPELPDTGSVHGLPNQKSAVPLLSVSTWKVTFTALPVVTPDV